MFIKTHRQWRLWLCALLMTATPVAVAQEYSAAGTDSCLPCHGPGMPLDATPIFATPHAARNDPQSPFSGLQCEACHGPGQDHVYAQQRGQSGLPSVVFGRDSDTPVDEQNAVCLGCHESQGRIGWDGSRHQSADLACAACHRVHRERDPVFDPLAQQQLCFDCHPQRRADNLKASAHPLRYGSMSCSDCHDPHNGSHDFLLREASVVETCFNCHAGKRGPFLWEHAPASEDCTLCHQPHGSNHPALLSKRPPLLCQQCHSPASHPSTPYTPELAADSMQNRFLLGRACLNCHSQVHGSNHPSGATLDR
jgi:DmsE family decaheme c-type cytochrome